MIRRNRCDNTHVQQRKFSKPCQLLLLHYVSLRFRFRQGLSRLLQLTCWFSVSISNIDGRQCKRTRNIFIWSRKTVSSNFVCRFKLNEFEMEAKPLNGHESQVSVVYLLIEWNRKNVSIVFFWMYRVRCIHDVGVKTTSYNQWVVY